MFPFHVWVLFLFLTFGICVHLFYIHIKFSDKKEKLVQKFGLFFLIVILTFGIICGNYILLIKDEDSNSLRSFNEDIIYTDKIFKSLKYGGTSLYKNNDYYNNIKNNIEEHKYDKIKVSTTMKKMSLKNFLYLDFLMFYSSEDSIREKIYNTVYDTNVVLIKETKKIHVNGFVDIINEGGKDYYTVDEHKFLVNKDSNLKFLLGKEVEIDIAYKEDTIKDGIIKDYIVLDLASQINNSNSL